MAVEVADVSKLDVEPGELPEKMAAWVIRQEREGEPTDAFQVEEIEVPEPGAFEVIVRVMAAGVNFNNVWAALGKPVSVFGYGDHPEYGHHIGGSDASGHRLEGRRGRHATGSPATRSSSTATRPPTRTSRSTASTRWPRPSSEIWGYETTWGSLRPVHEGPGAAAAAEAGEPLVGRLLRLRADLLHRLPDADEPGKHPGRPQRPDLGRGGRPRRLRRRSSARRPGANCVGVVSSAEKGELVKQLGAVDYIDRNEFKGMMRTGDEVADEEKARFKESRGFAKQVKSILGDAPDIVFEHVGQATFPTSVFTVKPFGKVVICGATSGYTLDFDVRYLWMKQKEILGSHFANAYECMRANQLMAEGKVRPVLCEAMGFEGVPEAHQMLHDNRHSGKITIRVGADRRRRRARRAEGDGAIWAEVGA